MPEAESRSGNTPNPWGELFKQVQEVAGALQKMWSPQSSSTNSSTPMPTVSESPPMNSNGSIPMPHAAAEPAGSSSTLNGKASVSSATSNPSRESEREGTLVIHFLAYGTAAQCQKDAETILKEIAVKGYEVVSATYNGKAIEAYDYHS